MKKLLLSILCMACFLFALPQAAWGEQMTVTVTNGSSTGTGTFTKTNTSGTYASVWTSTSTTPTLTLTCSVNNMGKNGTNITFWSGSNSSTGNYTIAISSGYKITGYSFNFTNVTTTTTMTVTPTGGTAVTCSNGASAVVNVTGLATTSAQFKVTESNNNNSAISTTNFIVYYEPITSFTIDLNNGTMSEPNTANTYYAVWSSNITSPQLTLATNACNMAKGDTNLKLYCYSPQHTGGYYLTISSGYVIKGYSFNFTNGNTSNNMTVIPEGLSGITCSGTGTATVNVTGLNSRSAYFRVSPATDATTYIAPTSFTVTVEAANTPGTAQSIFTTTASGSTRYRIPAITKMANGNLLAISDLRYGTADIGGNNQIDIVGRISSDNGSTWGNQFTILDGSGTTDSNDCGYGDGALVTDRTTGKILLMSAAGYIGYSASTRSNPIRMARTYSNDNGATWETPTDVTEAVYSLFDTRTSGSIEGMFIGSGKIMQSRVIKKESYYRLYAALCTRSGNFVIYSDNFGASWAVLGDINTSCAASGDEPKCEEMPNGSVVLSSRCLVGRIFNIFTYTNRNTATGTWGTATTSYSYLGGIAVGGKNSTNGEILRVKATRVSDSKVVRLMLQSLPWGYNRTDVAIYYRELNSADYAAPATFAAAWSEPYRVSLTTSAYSSMVMQGNGKVGFVYEETSQNSGYNTMYQALDISTLTGGKYTYAGEDVPYDLTFFENGTQTSAITVIDNEPIGTCMAADATPPTGYTFGGWNTNATYASSMTAPAYVTTATVPTASTSLYAVYNASGANYTTRYIPVTVTDLGYSTFCNSYDVAIPSGVEAYYGLYYGGTNPRVSMKPVSTMIPAGNGVILKNQGTYIFPATDLTTATDLTSNALVGYTTATAVSGSSDLIYYKLSYAGTDKSTVGFYYAGESAHAGFTSVAGRAYLKVSNSTPSPIQSLRMTFNEDPTSIDEITTGSTTGQRIIYDLAGRRVTNPVKGIYIVNGKKMFIK